MLDVVLKIIAEADYDKMYALRHTILREPLGLNLYTQDFSTEKNYIKVGAYLADDLVGCVLIEVLPNHVAKIRQMAVDAALQGRGVGVQLMQFAEQICLQHQVKTITMHARLSACKFYESLQYVCIGHEFIEVNIPHITMQKQLITAI
jgi:predicted GNAT family N-acyltransferase